MAIAITLIFGAQCTFDGDEENVVLTEAVVYVSSETARFSGRVVGSTDRVEDHGFQVSLSEDFSSPQTISLSEKGSPGLFVGEITGLANSTDYFYRAYMAVSGGTLFGDAGTFTTLSPSALSYGPVIERPGSNITISGTNITSDVEVYFGDTRGEIVDIQFESNIVVRVPQIENEVRVPIRVEMIEETYVLDTFEFIIGLWNLDTLSFPEANNFSIYEVASAKTDDHFTIGLGYNNTLNSSRRIWQLDLNTWTWEDFFYFGQESRSPFVFGSYFGSGRQRILFGSSLMNNELWQLTSSGLVQAGTLPFTVYKGIAAEIGGETFVYGGVDGSAQGDVYKFDGTTWELVGNQTFPLITTEISSDLPHFTINNEAFFIAEGIVWKFDPATLSYEQYDTAPVFACFDGLNAVVNDKFYMGICGGNSRDVFEYDPATKVWKEKAKFLAPNSGYNIASFVHDETIYLFTNPPLNLPTNNGGEIKLYTFKPDEF